MVYLVSLRPAGPQREILSQKTKNQKTNTPKPTKQKTPENQAQKDKHKTLEQTTTKQVEGHPKMHAKFWASLWYLRLTPWKDEITLPGKAARAPKLDFHLLVRLHTDLYSWVYTLLRCFSWWWECLIIAWPPRVSPGLCSHSQSSFIPPKKFHEIVFSLPLQFGSRLRWVKLFKVIKETLELVPVSAELPSTVCQIAPFIHVHVKVFMWKECLVELESSCGACSLGKRSRCPWPNHVQVSGPDFRTRFPASWLPSCPVFLSLAPAHLKSDRAHGQLNIYFFLYLGS